MDSELATKAWFIDQNKIASENWLSVANHLMEQEDQQFRQQEARKVINRLVTILRGFDFAEYLILSVWMAAMLSPVANYLIRHMLRK